MREIKSLQTSHQEQLDTLRKQNEKDFIDMKQELRNFLHFRKEQRDSNKEEFTHTDQVEEIKKSLLISKEDYHKPGATSQLSEAEKMFRSEIEDLRIEIDKLKHSSIEELNEHEFSEYDHHCKYGSKYKIMREKYSSLIQRVKDEKLNSKVRNDCTSNSSSESVSSFPSPVKPKKTSKLKKKLAIAQPSNSLSFESLGINMATLPTSTPKRSSHSICQVSKISENLRKELKDDEVCNLVMVEDSKILASTEQYLKSNKKRREIENVNRSFEKDLQLTNLEHGNLSITRRKFENQVCN